MACIQMSFSVMAIQGLGTPGEFIAVFDIVIRYVFIVFSKLSIALKNINHFGG